MSLIFFGTPSFAVPTLEKLLAAGEDIAAVVTQPDRVGGRGHKSIAPPVKRLAEGTGSSVIQPDNIRTADFTAALRSMKPEFIVVVAYGKILPKAILELPEKGCINLHASLLPRHRGAAPVQWAVINGDRTSGVTTIMMDEGLDTGDILMQRPIDIAEDDTSLSLSEKLSNAGADLLLETLAGLRKGSVTPLPQSGESSYAPLLRKEDGIIDWSMSAEAISNRVRGLFPWPCAYTYYRGKMIKVLKARRLEGSGSPGEVLHKDKEALIIGTSEGLIRILELQAEGGKPMETGPFLQGVGRSIEEGEKLG